MSALAAKIEPICSRLSAEPLFHLSLNSKELFHTNVLAWFAEHYPADAAEALGRWAEASPYEGAPIVRREYKHLDLYVHLPGQGPIVIENKVFSLPDEEQLDRYTAEAIIGIDAPNLVLLSLTPPVWQSNSYTTAGQTWQFVSYGELADAIDAVANRMASSLDPERRFAGELLQHYVVLVRLLVDLVAVAGVVEVGDPVAVDADTAALLVANRVHDAIGKLRARVAISFIRSTLGSPEVAGHPLRWESGFTNGSPLNSAFVILPGGDWLGWQYQVGQWRLAAVTASHTGISAESKEARVEHVQSTYGPYFDFAAVESVLEVVPPVPSREASGGWNHYNPDFIYRYRKAPRLTLGEMAQLSAHYLQTAAVYARIR
jgi:hypothetical protein